MLLSKNGSSALHRSAVIAGFAGAMMAVAASAESPGLVGAKSESVKPLARIDKETMGFDVTCFALAVQGDVVALGGSDGTIRLWSQAESKVIRSLDVAKDH